MIPPAASAALTVVPADSCTARRRDNGIEAPRLFSGCATASHIAAARVAQLCISTSAGYASQLSRKRHLFIHGPGNFSGAGVVPWRRRRCRFPPRKTQADPNYSAEKFPYSLPMRAPAKEFSRAPEWATAMQPGLWCRISGNAPDLDLAPTPIGTRYLEDNDPARDPALNPPRTLKETVRRLAGRDWIAPWRGRVGFSSITEAWNGAVYASRFGRSGAMIVFGGGHNDYFGSDVHAFDLARREWRRLTTGFVTGRPDEYGEGAIYPAAVYPDNSPLPPHTYDYVQYDEVGNDFHIAAKVRQNSARTSRRRLFHTCSTWIR